MNIRAIIRKVEFYEMTFEDVKTADGIVAEIEDKIDAGELGSYLKDHGWTVLAELEDMDTGELIVDNHSIEGV